jgi:hypothetical protein
MNTDPGHLEAACEQAWRELDAAERAMPHCEHVTAWIQRKQEARRKHLAALHALDAAGTADPAGAAAVPPSLPAAPEPALGSQEALSEFGTEAA